MTKSIYSRIDLVFTGTALAQQEAISIAKESLLLMLGDNSDIRPFNYLLTGKEGSKLAETFLKPLVTWVNNHLTKALKFDEEACLLKGLRDGFKGEANKEKLSEWKNAVLAEVNNPFFNPFVIPTKEKQIATKTKDAKFFVERLSKLLAQAKKADVNIWEVLKATLVQVDDAELISLIMAEASEQIAEVVEAA